MKTILSVVLMIALLTGLSLATPLEMLSWKERPGVIPLSGVAPESAKAIANTNGPLGAYVPWDLPDLGKLDSYWVLEKQDINSTEKALEEFAGSD